MNLWKKHPVLIVSAVTLLSYVALFYIPKKPVPVWTDEQLRHEALTHGMQPVPATYKQLLAVVDSPANPMSRDKIALGKRLFFDPILSRDRTINCASCHVLEAGGDDNRPTAIGYHGRANPFHLNSPTVLNAALEKHQFWDGRVPTVEDQAGGPVQAPFEMNLTPKEAVERVGSIPSYRQAFDTVFGEHNVTFETIRLAIGAYERTLLTRGAFDRFLEGDNAAMSAKAKRGMTLFIAKGCKGCHSGMGVGGEHMEQFPVRRPWDENLGLEFSPSLNIRSNPYPFPDLGHFRGRNGARWFRVPLLRNITQTAPYFHNGSVKKLEEVVRIMSKYQIGDEFSPKQIDEVVAFLKTLEGKLVDYTEAR